MSKILDTKVRFETNETLEDVENFLNNNEIDHFIFEKPKLVRFEKNEERYDYYWTTGRWARRPKFGHPKKHYRSSGIQDFIERFYNEF